MAIQALFLPKAKSGKQPSNNPLTHQVERNPFAYATFGLATITLAQPGQKNVLQRVLST